MLPTVNTSDDVRSLLTGFDPYDAMRGERVPSGLRRHKVTRQLLIQLRKRCPVDLAPLLGIRPFVMAKAGGCYLSAFARKASVDGECGPVRSVAEFLLSDPSVARLPEGAWGYEFDVQTRWAFYPAGSANLIATRFVALGMAEASLVCSDAELLGHFRSAAEYVMTSLYTGRHFAYTTTTEKLVHNANLLGASLVGACGAIFGVREMLDAALSAARVSVAAQNESGSWPYGEGSALGWVDNFHTAYNLDALHTLFLVTHDAQVERALVRGIDFWEREFFSPDGAPAYMAGSAAPYDIHSAATAVDVSSRLALAGRCPSDLPSRIRTWTLDNLIDARTGKTYYRRGERFVDKRNFVRWGDAHWACAESSFALLERGMTPPLDARLRAGERASAS